MIDCETFGSLYIAAYNTPKHAPETQRVYDIRTFGEWKQLTIPYDTRLVTEMSTSIFLTRRMIEIYDSSSY